MELIVYLTRSSDKPVFKRVLLQNDGLSFDFNRCIAVMRDLFGSSCIVEFRIIN